MKKIILIRDTSVGGTFVFKGQVLKVDENTEKLLIQYGHAVPFNSENETAHADIIDQRAKVDAALKKKKKSTEPEAPKGPSMAVVDQAGEGDKGEDKEPKK